MGPERRVRAAEILSLSESSNMLSEESRPAPLKAVSLCITLFECESWCREREIVTSLISSPIMTQPRSLSGLPEDTCLPASPAFASPLLSSMVCAASLVSSVSCSPAAQSGPSIGFTFTPSIPLIEEGAGEAASLTLPHVQNFMKVFVHHHGSCLEGPQNPHYKGQKQAQHRLRCARAAFRYPDQGLLTSLRYRVCVS